MKYMISPMLSQLRALSQICELIAFTHLSRAFVDCLYSKLPDLRHIFSYTFTLEDIQVSE